MTREVKSSVTSFTNCKNERLSESARCHSRPLIKLTSRTRSVSPAPQNLLVSGKLPFKKFSNIYAKVVVQLEHLKNILETKKNEVENLADLRRQLQRGDEFSIRFSRNNIYETRRIMGDIKKIMVEYSNGTLPSAECKALGKKIILVYQAASQALQTYINYVKNPSNLEVPDKINELVVLIADMFLFCDHLSLVPSEARIKNDSVKVCNDLMEVLSKKVTPLQELRLKETEIKKKAKSQSQSQTGEVSKNNLSMYMTKLTRSKTETAKKQKTSFLLLKPKKAEKKNEDAARITHEIYTQKMSPQLLLKKKIVKFEPGADDEKKQTARTHGRRSKFTPREVKSQDDDVETIIQTIADEETTIGKRRLTPRESDEESSGSNKSTIRQLLLEAIDELQQPENKPRKTTLEKLLHSIQNHPRNPNVKVYNFKSKDFDVEEEPKEEEEEEEKKLEVDLMKLHEKQKELDEILSKERRLKIKFKLAKEKKTENEEGEVVPGGKIRLKISKDMVDNLNKQRKAFYEFRNSNIMYKKTLANKPWDLIAKVADHVLLDTIREVALDFQNDALLRRLYLNELLEVTN